MSDFIKKTIIVLVIFFTCVSCEELVQVDVPETAPRLVIEATFNRFEDENANGGRGRSEGIVKLSLSAPFFEKEIPPALGAQVTIEDPVNSIVYQFIDQGNDGNYFASFVPDFDIPYTLTVIYEGETYQSTTELQQTGMLVGAIQGDKTLFNAEDKEVIITLKDSPDSKDYYFLDLDVGNFLLTDDEFYNGNDFTFSYFYEDLEIGDNLIIKLFGVDQRFTSFFEILQSQSGEDGGGGPFATPPVTVRGNIRNVTNPRNFPFGYFRLSAGSEISIEITK